MNRGKENRDDKFNLVYPLSLVTQIGVTVAVIAGAFILGGKFLDDYFHASPVFIILGGIFAFAASMFAVYQLVLPMMKEGEGNEKKKSLRK